MPSFTNVVSNLYTVGPVIEIMIAVGSAIEQALLAQGSPIPNPIRVLAMIDTGSTGTVVQRGLAAQLGLNPIGTTLISTPSSNAVQCFKYNVRLLLPNSIFFDGTAIDAPLLGQHIQCLIGRDVLAHCVFIYNGYANQFTLSL